MSNEIGESQVRYYALARQALVQALQLAQIGNGDNVLIPALICKDVVASVHTVGATPIFYEVDENLAPLEFAKFLNFKAAIAVNYFGFPQDLKIFKQQCELVGASLIEDNAHGYLSQDSSGQHLGTRSNFGIVSIRKTLRIADGAQLLINNNNIKSLPSQLTFTQLSPGLRPVLQRFLVETQQTIHLPLLDWARSLVRIGRKLLTGKALPISPPSAEFEKIILCAPRESSMKRITQLDEHAEVERRRTLYVKVESVLTKCEVSPIFSSLPHGCVPYGYPFYASTSNAKSAGLLVKHLGVEVIHWPDLPESVVDLAPKHYKDIWLVNFL
jgi:hypothetical protein